MPESTLSSWSSAHSCILSMVLLDVIVPESTVQVVLNCGLDEPSMVCDPDVNTSTALAPSPEEETLVFHLSRYLV